MCLHSEAVKTRVRDSGRSAAAQLQSICLTLQPLCSDSEIGKNQHINFSTVSRTDLETYACACCGIVTDALGNLFL